MLGIPVRGRVGCRRIPGRGRTGAVWVRTSRRTRRPRCRLWGAARRDVCRDHRGIAGTRSSEPLGEGVADRPGLVLVELDDAAVGDVRVKHNAVADLRQAQVAQLPGAAVGSAGGRDRPAVPGFWEQLRVCHQCHLQCAAGIWVVRFGQRRPRRAFSAPWRGTTVVGAPGAGKRRSARSVAARWIASCGLCCPGAGCWVPPHRFGAVPAQSGNVDVGWGECGTWAIQLRESVVTLLR